MDGVHASKRREDPSSRSDASAVHVVSISISLGRVGPNTQGTRRANKERTHRVRLGHRTGVSLLPSCSLANRRLWTNRKRGADQQLQPLTYTQLHRRTNKLGTNDYHPSNKHKHKLPSLGLAVSVSVSCRGIEREQQGKDRIGQGVRAPVSPCPCCCSQ